MPRLPIDYSKTIIYKICCNDVSIKEIYVGHTTDLIRRRQKHKESCNNEKSIGYNYNVYQFIRANEGWYNWSLVPVEEYPCENVNQARIRERYWIEELKASLNKLIPSRSRKEYQKEYHEQNRDKIAEKHKKYYEQNKDKIKEYDKKYYERNKDKNTEKSKQRYESNKDKFLEKITCECGGFYTYKHKSRHFKTKKHQEYLSTVDKDRQETSP